MIGSLLFAALLGSALWDWRTGKIPNMWLFFWFLILGAEKAFLCRGSPVGELIRYGADAALAIVCLFPLFLFRMMGAGDIKLMALAIGVLGRTDGMRAVFYGLAASAVWSFIFMARRRILWKRIKYFLNYTERFVQTGQICPYYQRERDGREAAFCFAPFLLLGYGLWAAVKGGII